MKALYIGDIMGQPGIKVVEKFLPPLIKDMSIDFVIAQAENVTDGKGISVEDMKKLQGIGVDFFSGGNHTPYLAEIHSLLEDPGQPIIGPANMTDSPGHGWKFVETKHGRVLIVTLLGSTVGRAIQANNPVLVIDAILEDYIDTERVATIVNFHGDFSSEKRIIGYHLDGRVSAVIGDHWHVPTADAMILPNGTAHITDVGMCGSLHSSLGVKLDSVIPRWRYGVQTKNELEDSGPLQFNAVLIDIDTGSGKPKSIEHIQMID